MLKKFLGFLFLIQLVIMSIYGLSVFKQYNVNNLISSDKSTLILNFGGDYQDYEFFLNCINEEGIEVYKYIFINDKSINIYTSDMTIGENVFIKSGKWPNSNTTEFVSNINTDEQNQVGLIYNTFPDYKITISHINSARNFSIDGTYYISTTDLKVVDNILNKLRNNIYSVELISINNKVDIINQVISENFIESAVALTLISLCVVISLVQYSISRLRTSTILLIHGYSKSKLSKNINLELLTLLIIPSIIAYLLLMIYSSLLIGYPTDFLLKLSLYFIFICIIFIFLYIIFINIFILTYLYILTTTNILKGKKPYYFVQILNNLLKIIFIVFLFLTIGSSVKNLETLNYRKETLSDWEKTKNIYKVVISYAGQENLAIDLDIASKIKLLDDYMSEYYNGFIMNSKNIFYLDQGLNPYSDPINSPPLEISPYGYSVEISPNYLKINPIIAVNEVPIQSQIIYDDNVLNILVPEYLQSSESDILKEYLDYFYFQKVEVDNIYNKDLRLELNTMSEKDLKINIIYVKNGQGYFSFDSKVRPKDGNIIKDPVAMIYTGNVHPSFISSNFTNSYYFYVEAIDAYSALLPHLIKYDLGHVIQRLKSVYDENGYEIVKLHKSYLKNLGYTLLLFIANLIITYNLMVNYFEKNKYKLFIKSLFGYDIIKRNIYFVAVLLTYSTLATIILTLTLDSKILVFALLVNIIEISIALFIEHMLLNKSFNNTTKGEQ